MKLAVGVLMTWNGKLFVSKREAPSDGRHAGIYCGAGGLCEEGESLRSAACRELKEETGLKVSRMRFIWLYSNEADTGKFRYLANHFLLELLPGEVPLHMEPEKAGPWELVSYQEADALPLVPGMKEAMAEVTFEVLPR